MMGMLWSVVGGSTRPPKGGLYEGGLYEGGLYEELARLS